VQSHHARKLSDAASFSYGSALTSREAAQE